VKGHVIGKASINNDVISQLLAGGKDFFSKGGGAGAGVGFFGEGLGVAISFVTGG
jgi:hypothetical protein